MSSFNVSPVAFESNHIVLIYFYLVSPINFNKFSSNSFTFLFPVMFHMFLGSITALGPTDLGPLWFSGPVSFKDFIF